MLTMLLAVLAAPALHTLPPHADRSRIDAFLDAQGVPPRALDFDLADIGGAGADHRFSAPAIVTDGDGRRDDPFSFSAIDDDRQQLRFGIKPGLRRARLGLTYRRTLTD